MEAAVGVTLLSWGEASLCPACGAQGPCKVRQMVAAPGKSTRLLSSAICRAATGLASGSSAHVPSPWGSQDRGSDWDLIAQRDWHPSSSRGKAGAQREAITTGIFSLAQAREAGKHMVLA